MEDKVYTQDGLRNENILTMDYRLNLEVGRFVAVLDLKAEARNCLRVFFTFEDGRKVLAAVQWWQKYLGMYETPIGTKLLLHYGKNSRGKVYLNAAERLKWHRLSKQRICPYRYRLSGASAPETPVEGGPKMTTTNISLSRLVPFEEHPYQVRDDEEMQALTDSIKEQGVLSPVIVRPLENGNYEIISGHRRCHAAQKAGLTSVPAVVLSLTHEEAAVALVDSNLHREHLLPSEKAFAYKLKSEAMKHQGKKRAAPENLWDASLISPGMGQDVPKPDDNRTTAEIGEQTGESYKTVQRYIRLTYLVPELLKLVDERKVAMTSAVYLSYLSVQEQSWLLEEMAANDCTPSVSQACRLKEKSQNGTLTQEFDSELTCQEKANQKERIRISTDRIRRFFPKGYTHAQMEDIIVKLCESYYKRRTEKDR